jgi:hypothetical protein
MRATGERIYPVTDNEMLRMLRIAEEMESDNPLWIIVFGVYSRQFVAFPRFSAPVGTMAVASYPPALTERMRAIERTLRIRRMMTPWE